MIIDEQFQIFNEACDELQNSKIILADAKVSKLLRSIVSSPNLVEIIGNALVGYNFENEFSKCVSKTADGVTSLTIPAEPYKVVALVFSLLTEFDSHRIDLQEFILNYFKTGNLTKSFEHFNKELIAPFQHYMNKFAGQDDDSEPTQLDLEEAITNDADVEETSQEVDDKDTPTKLFADLKVIFEQIQETVQSDSRLRQEQKDDLNITIEALLETLRLKNFKLLNALLISLNNMIGNLKSTKYYHQELQNRLAKFYNEFM